MCIQIKNVKFYKNKSKIIFYLFIILIIVVLFIIFFISNFSFYKIEEIPENIYSKNNYIQNLNSKNNSKIKRISHNLYQNVYAYLTIPILNLYNAPISEGTSQSVMQKYIGHFSNTSYDIGNIGLASHNRGSGATYFQDLYKLKESDYIFYTYKNVTKMYKVEKIVVIDSYDWSFLENTYDNRLTLITCINNKPNYRLCVQAIQL